MTNNSIYKERQLSRCKYKVWKDQKIGTTLKGVEKSYFRDCCLYMRTDGTCSHPDIHADNLQKALKDKIS